MTRLSRSFSAETDLTHMAALAQEDLCSNLHVIDLPYRLCSWALDEPENARLWFDPPGRLVAWAVLQSPFWTIDYALHPGAQSGLHCEVLEWALDRAGRLAGTPYARPAWFVTAFASQARRIADLGTAGFACQAEMGEDSWSKLWLRRSGDRPVKEYRLPVGFTVRPLAGSGEVEAYVELHRYVFESKNMTAGWRQRTLEHPAYQNDLDIVVAAPDGRLAAFCVGWLLDTPHGLAGQIEPLGCHPNFRRYALGRVALAEVLRRMQARGVGDIYVETDHYRGTALALYESLDFQFERKVLVFRYDLDNG